MLLAKAWHLIARLAASGTSEVPTAEEPRRPPPTGNKDAEGAMLYPSRGHLCPNKAYSRNVSLRGSAFPLLHGDQQPPLLHRPALPLRGTVGGGAPTPSTAL